MNTLSFNIKSDNSLSSEFVGPPTETDLSHRAVETVAHGTVVTRREAAASAHTNDHVSQDEIAADDDNANSAFEDLSSGRIAEAPNQKNAILDLIKKFGSFSSMVRVVGVGALVLSMGLFLLDGMGVVNDTQRFFTMLILTGLLSAGGFALAFMLKEQRGARAFLGLALLSVPVNFAVLGALFYSVFQFDSVATHYPSVAHWNIQSLAGLGSAALIAAITLIPVTLIATSVLARESRIWLSGALLLSSSTLLLPVRDTLFIAPMVAMIVIALIWVVKSRAEGVISLKTPAGRFVQALLFLPPAVMMFRSFWLYSVSALAAMVVSLTIFVALRYASNRTTSNGLLVNTLHVTSIVVAFIAALLSVDIVYGATGHQYWAFVFCAVFGTLMFDIETRVRNVTLARVVGFGASVVLGLVALVHQQLFDGVIVFLLSILVSAAIVGVGLLQKRKDKLLLGGLTLASIMLLNVSGVFDFFQHAGWLGFACLGVVAILFASLVERFGTVTSMRMRQRFMPN